MDGVLKHINDISMTDAPKIHVSGECKSNFCKCTKEKTKEQEPKLKILSIGYFSENKPLRVIDKEQEVILKLEYENQEELLLAIQLEDSADYYFEFKGEKVEPYHRIVITDGQKEIRLKVRFKDLSSLIIPAPIKFAFPTL